MSVLKSDDGSELIVICNCGCDEGLHIIIEKDRNDIDPDNDLFCYTTCLNSNWYRDHNKRISYIIWDKLRKIWAIIRSKDYCYSEIMMSRKDFEVFREYINGVE